MNRLTISVAAVAAVMAAGVAVAQQKGNEEKASPQMQGSPGAQSQQSEGAPQKGTEKAEPKSKDQPGKGTAQKAEPKDKGTAQKGADPKDKATKGTAEKAEPQNKGTAQKSNEPQDKSTKGTAQKAEPKDKGTAQKGVEPQDKSTKGTAQKNTEPSNKAEGTAQRGSTERTQVSEQQKTNISQTLLKEKSVNRVTKVDFSINMGTRVPRSLRLVALPASIIAIVPAYRSYRYFVADERICIVDPATYEIVDVITISDRTAGTSQSGGARLVLTDEEREIILSEIDMGGRSTLGLGALSEGAEVPREVELRVFPDRVVQKVPKVKGYHYAAAENRVAIVEPQSHKVQLVIEQRR